LDQIQISLPGSLAGENPVDFAAGGFHLASSSVHLPAVAPLWDWILPPFGAALACGAWGWIGSRTVTPHGLWSTLKST